MTPSDRLKWQVTWPSECSGGATLGFGRAAFELSIFLHFIWISTIYQDLFYHFVFIFVITAHLLTLFY